jgi:hypothetical protein
MALQAFRSFDQDKAHYTREPMHKLVETFCDVDYFSLFSFLAPIDMAFVSKSNNQQDSTCN